MPLTSTEETELRQALRDFRAANGLAAIPGGAGKAVEAWVMMRLAKAASAKIRWRVTLRDGAGALLAPGAAFVFPTHQGGIPGLNPAAPSFIHLENIRDGSRSLELHNSLQWRGRSGATHEIDVAIIPARLSSALRANGGGLPRGLPVLAVECKDKTSAGTPDEMRQTLARMFDLALVTKPTGYVTCRAYEDVTMVTWGRWRRTYVGFFSRGTFAIARIGKFTAGAIKIARHYHIQTIDDVVGSSHASMKRLERHLHRTLNGIGGV